eukprot:comp19143_c0_seq1/m.21806 comp19143_c0_seq1/g.21806  ORF comp19143_c0_seq1/g.21806 comp19143_c0_seq1/m.21806 type:complete len:388 (-) comp19143_c0_seq1:511-1674(-)
MLNFFGDQLPAEQAAELAKYLDELTGKGGLAKEVEAAVAESNLNNALGKLIDASQAIFALPEAEIEGPFNSIIYLLRFTKAEEGLVTKLVGVVSSASDKSTARLKVLTTLYNNLEAGHTDRPGIYRQVVKVAGQAKKVDALAPQLQQLDSLVAEWGLDEAQKRDLYHAIYEAAKASGRSELARKYLVTYLQSFDKAEPDALASVKVDATQVIVDSVGISDLYQLDDLLDIKAVAQLKGEKIYALLLIFIEGDVKAWNTFVAENTDYVHTLGLNQEECLRKMRLLTLTSLASGTTQVAYSSVVEHLEIAEDEAELWIIDAIRAGLIEARMDQAGDRVIVRRAMARTFQPPQWKNLQERLAVWVNSVNEIKKSLHNVRDQQAHHDQRHR